MVTTLWSTSWVLVKIGLKDIPAVTFAGLRYFLAFLILIPVFDIEKGDAPSLPLQVKLAEPGHPGFPGTCALTGSPPG